MAAWGVIDLAYLAGYAALMLTATPVVASALTITDALIERFGLLIIIVLGETLTGVVQGLVSEPVSAATLSVGLVCVLVGFGAWWTYFDFAGHRHLVPGRAAAFTWMIGHLPLTAAIAAMGAAMVSLIRHAHDGHTPTATAWMLGGGGALVLAATMLIASSLADWEQDRAFYRPLARTCALAAATCLGIAALRPAPLILGILLVVALGIPWVNAIRLRLDSTTSSPGHGSPGHAEPGHEVDHGTG